jgi:hypothetical protein
MERSSILAHRGLWFHEEEKNSRNALSRALEEGFGIETDLRDHNAEIVISHNPPKESSNTLKFEWLLQRLASSDSAGRVALNIKSDGLSRTVENHILEYGLQFNRFFVFDMSVPDSLSYLAGSIPVYSRLSEYEQVLSPLPGASGFWVDSFTGIFPQVEVARHLINQGHRITLVSAELHSREHISQWNAISKSGIYLSPLFQLCTDFPVEAAIRFSKA